MRLTFASSRCARLPALRRVRRERGVVLFIALLVMVALSLAGVALLRSADTATTVAGNLAFKQSAAAAVDRSIEQAVQALFDPQPVATPTSAARATATKPVLFMRPVQASPGPPPPARPAAGFMRSPHIGSTEI